MNFKSISQITLFSLFAVISTLAFADNDHDGMRMYEITITNTSYHHPLTPPIVIAHNSHFQLFNLAQPASEGLIAIAEGGNTAPLVDALSSDMNVSATATGDGLIMPGHSATIHIMAPRKTRFSLASMLAKTNDAFIAIRNVHSPKKHRMSHLSAMVYDAGSESNNEMCSYIPACSGEDQMTDEGEGYVTLHNGFHGVGDFGSAAELDWRGPIAMIKIK